MRNDPIVDAVIAVHDPSRPIARAVASLTRSGLRAGDGLRITVVCHNLPVESISRQLTAFEGPGLRFLHLEDGIASAAGPFNAGIEAATAGYVSIMGSDDRLEPGALAAWLEFTSGRTADAVIAPQVHASGSPVRTPPVRKFHRGDLDAVRDRLAYRTAPLGLMSRAAIDRLTLRFPAGLPTGEDQSFSARLWFEGEGLRYAASTPRYVVGADAATRVSTTPRALHTEFAFIEQLIGDPWYLALPLTSRAALAVKLVRIHIFAATLARIDAGAFDDDDHSTIVRVIERLRSVAPAFERPLSIADRRTIDAMARTDADAAHIGELARARRRFGLPSTLVTRDLRGLFAVEGPLRFMAASALL
ncbi:glycosyltransferase family 2 protein [Leifsonia sp. NPDC058292]|uniref:glycosyltransferase family 2 protein n=1 Tax=Leifsonia sp. NPDC058292 TaxID=3346428 RepID=UPI0036DA055E